MLAAFAGALAGLLHVFSGPDHLAAVAPLSIDHGRKAWGVGLRWGIGHSGGVILLGLLLLLLREVLPLDGIAAGAERLVGVVLIGIGIWGLRKAFANKVHLHAHDHDGRSHVHLHVHGTETAHQPDPPEAPKRLAAHRHSHAVMGVGLLHGVAGGSHLVSMLVALTFPTRMQTASFVIAYALGTIVAMTSFSGVIGWIAMRCSGGGNAAYRNLMFACSSAALIVGAYWLLMPVTH